MIKDTIINDIATREELINRVEVLDKVKQLLLIPRLQFTTIPGVADFYDVEIEAIKKLVQRNKKELLSDGMVKFTRKEAIELKGQSVLNVTIESNNVEIGIDDEHSIKIANRGAMVFPRRAILRVGMLLRDSIVAQEIRTQLLNIEETIAPEIKVSIIDAEVEMLERIVGSAFVNNNVEEFAKAMKELDEYNNRFSIEATKALEDENFLLKDALTSMSDLVESLELTNKVLSEQISTVATVETYRRVVITMMIRLSEQKKFGSPYLCYKQLYTILRNDHEIDLAGRKYKLTKDEAKGKSQIDCIQTTDEWNKALKVSTAMCYKDGVDIDDLLKQLENVEKPL